MGDMRADDPAAEALGAIAADACPAIVAAASTSGIDIRSLSLQLMTSGPERQVYAAIDGHPLLQACVAALRADPQLQALLPDDTGMQAFVMFSRGGSRMGVDDLPLALIDAAASEVLFSGTPMTVDALREKALLNLTRIREGVAGRPIEVLNLVGYSGIPLPQSKTISTPWGQIRALTAPDWLVPTNNFGLGLTPLAQIRATAILQMTTEETLLISHDAQPLIDPAPFQVASERSQRIATELVPLALVLGTADDPLRPQPLWQLPILPWSLGRGWSGWLAPYNLRQRAGPLEDGDLEEIERWSRLVNDHYHEEVSFVGRRIVTAISARWTPEDVLVDSVVAWENLVGGAPETTFRTSTAMACLLEDNPNARLTLQHRLGVIYGARSDVVHGRLGKDLSEWKWRLEEGTEKVGLDAIADDALQIAMRGLKALIQRRPDLASIKPAERSRRLVMGA
jgi:hypothetical protein